MASAVQRPCLSAFVLPVGAPLPAAPPCILHLRFPRTAGDWHKPPLRVRAPHRGARFMGDFSDCIGWFPGFLITPAPGGDGTDDRLGTGMDMDVLEQRGDRRSISGSDSPDFSKFLIDQVAFV